MHYIRLDLLLCVSDFNPTGETIRKEVDKVLENLKEEIPSSNIDWEWRLAL